MGLGRNLLGTYVYILGEGDNGHTPIADNRASGPCTVVLFSDEVHVSAKNNGQISPEERNTSEHTFVCEILKWF